MYSWIIQTFSTLFKHYFNPSEIHLKPALESVISISSSARELYHVFHKKINFPQSPFPFHLNTIKTLIMRLKSQFLFAQSAMIILVMNDDYLLIQIFCISMLLSTERYRLHILRPVLQLSQGLKAKRGFQELICARKKPNQKPKIQQHRNRDQTILFQVLCFELKCFHILLNTHIYTNYYLPSSTCSDILKSKKRKILHVIFSLKMNV